jgi:hypothetical protein
MARSAMSKATLISSSRDCMEMVSAIITVESSRGQKEIGPYYYEKLDSIKRVTHPFQPIPDGLGTNIFRNYPISH